MSHKLLPRLGSAIASTILSLFSGVLLVGVDKAQAAVLSFNFNVDEGVGSGFFKVSDSSLTRIGLEQVAVSEGRLNTILIIDYLGLEGKKYYDLAGATALFYQGDFRGLSTGGGDSVTREINNPDDPNGPFYLNLRGRASWSINTIGQAPMRISYFYGYREVYSTNSGGTVRVADRRIVRDTPVSYTLVNTEAEPVPEPLTAGGTALALAGLSWLKQKKKMAA
jgi:hypothetical protein